MLSRFLRSAVDELRDVEQRPDYHPELWVFDHTAYVLKGVRRRAEFSDHRLRELELVALFHDIAKIDTTKRNSDGVLTSYNHSTRSCAYWDAAQPFIEDRMRVRGRVVRWLVDNHMKPKFFGQSKRSTVDALRQDADALGPKVWMMLNAFNECDDMRAFFKRNDMHYASATPIDTPSTLYRDGTRSLDVHRSALEAFDAYVDEVCQRIAYAECETERMLVLVRGVPGSGKTTFAERALGGVNVCADQFFVDEAGVYTFDRSRIGEAHAWCESRVATHMDAGEAVIAVHNTFTQPWEMVAYYALASRHGYQVHSVIVENRHQGETVHGVPDDKIRQMADRFHVKIR